MKGTILERKIRYKFPIFVTLILIIALLFLSSGNPISTGHRYANLPFSITLMGPVPEQATSSESPGWVAFDPMNGNIYVANYNGGSVSVINGSNNLLVASIHIAPYLEGISFDGLNGYIYVSDGNSTNVTVIDGADNEVLGNISVGFEPDDAAYDSADGSMYVAVVDGYVSVVNSSSNSVEEKIAVGIQPGAICYDPVNNRIYVTNYQSDNVSVIDGRNNEVVGSIQLGPPFSTSNPKGPVGIVADLSNGYVYVTINSHYLLIANATSNQVTGNISIGSYLQGITYDNSNGYLYIVSEFNNTVSALNGTTNTVKATIEVGQGPVGITYDSSNGHIYVANQNSDDVSAINGTTNKVTSTTHVSNVVTPVHRSGFNTPYWTYVLISVIVIVTAASMFTVFVRNRRRKA